MQEQQAAAERLAQEPEDAESIALAIRLQQEDDEAALRNALGVLPNASGDDGDEPGSPSQYSYEQLMMLGETVGEVSRGAKQDDITRLRVLTHHKCVADSTVILGEQCSICRMEFESDDELRVLPCGHAEHSECIDQWLAVNKSCPICMKEINAPPAPPAASAAVTDSACPTCPPDATPSVPASSSSQPVTPAEAPVSERTAAIGCVGSGGLTDHSRGSRHARDAGHPRMSVPFALGVLFRALIRVCDFVCVYGHVDDGALSCPRRVFGGMNPRRPLCSVQRAWHRKAVCARNVRCVRSGLGRFVSPERHIRRRDEHDPERRKVRRATVGD